MRIETLSLRNFRNHAETDIRFSGEQNLLVGKNGAGKTNALEGAAYVCLGRSFYAATDGVLVTQGKDRFQVRATMRSDADVSYSVEVGYGPGTARQIRIGGADVPRRSDLIGMFPVVILSPEHGGVTSGGPGERRRLMDLTLSQAVKRYLEDMLEYRRALRQRNRLLLEARQQRRVDRSALDPWTRIVVERGAGIVARRRSFLDAFRPYVADAVRAVSGWKETAEMVYQPSVGTDEDTEGLMQVFGERLEALERDEVRAGTTLAGPHRDEVELLLNGLPMRQYASQGQHKTFLIGLKFAEFRYLRRVCSETPLLLLDDVFSELDEERTGRVVELMEESGQVIITSADERPLPGAGSGRVSRFRVAGGQVHADESERANAETAG